MSQFGEVSDYSGELVEHPLGSAELYLQASDFAGPVLVSLSTVQSAR
ncbi:hypothetical protein [Paenibacillus sp. MABNR03]